MYIESIIDNLNNPYLKQTNNEGRKVLDGTIGEYLEQYDTDMFSYIFLNRATGKYLDIIGEEYGLIRKEDETDNAFRNRINIEKTFLESTNDFKKIDVQLFTYNQYFINELNNTSSKSWHMVSDNTLIRNNDRDYMFIGVTDEETKEYVKNKFIVEDILWV